MNNKLKPIYLVMAIIILAVPAFMIGPILWPTAADSPIPTPTQSAFFLMISLIEAMLFSAGLVFLFFGFDVVKKAPSALRRVGWMFYLSAAWMLMSWWPHDNFHRSVDENNLQKLLFIEYGFHLTLIVAGLAIAYAFFRIFLYIEETETKGN